MIFFNHPIIYQAMTQPVDVDDEPGLESIEAWEPPVVLRPRIAYISSSIVDVVEFSLEEPGWEQSQDPEIIRRPISMSFDSTSFTPDEVEAVVVEGPGWDQAPPPPIVLRQGYYLPDWTGDVEDFDEEQPGWEQSQEPEIVRRVPVFIPDWIGDVVDFSLEEPGWYVPGPPVILRPGYYQSITEEVLDDIAEQGEHGFWVDPPPVIRRIPFHLIPDNMLDLSGLTVDFVPPAIFVETKDGIVLISVSGVTSFTNVVDGIVIRTDVP